jgi:ABC-type antimicrobial peptide transport system permease subunit
MVIGQVMALTIGGAAMGIPAALARARMMRAALFQVSASDQVMLTGVSVFIVAIGVVAGLRPGRHAASVDPATALRHE